ncbi:Peroxidase 24 [Forsythia ovata]|uniref:peroxidase n=1 Tax=Forsythia ovata TaxID=205694 RepID=A0ABD1P5R4_9LAMI
MWDVLTGRRDGRVSLISDVSGNLPSPFSDFPTLQTLFEKKGLNINDIVALSAFSRRLFNFTGKGDTDPSLDPTYAETLKCQCPNPANPATTVEMDPQSSLSFDTHYFAAVNQNKGLFQSDAALLMNPTSAGIVKQLEVPWAFFNQFGKSMVNMGAIEVLVGNAGEIRKNCRVGTTLEVTVMSRNATHGIVCFSRNELRRSTSSEENIHPASFPLLMHKLSYRRKLPSHFGGWKRYTTQA